MNKKFFLIIGFPLCMGLTMAQEREMKFGQLIGSVYTDPGLTKKGIYLNDEFAPGSVVFNSGDSISGLFLRYNSQSDELIWLTKDYGQVILDKFIIDGFSLNLKNAVVHFRQMRLSTGDSVPGFYQDIYQGKVTLLVKRKVDHASDYYKNKIHFSVYKPDPQYYLMIGTKTYHPSRPTIKSMYALFPGLKEQLQQQVRSRHLKDKNETDFVEFIRGVEENFQTSP